MSTNEETEQVVDKNLTSDQIETIEVNKCSDKKSIDKLDNDEMLIEKSNIDSELNSNSDLNQTDQKIETSNEQVEDEQSKLTEELNDENKNLIKEDNLDKDLTDNHSKINEEKSVDSNDQNKNDDNLIEPSTENESSSIINNQPETVDSLNLEDNKADLTNVDQTSSQSTTIAENNVQSSEILTDSNENKMDVDQLALDDNKSESQIEQQSVEQSQSDEIQTAIENNQEQLFIQEQEDSNQQVLNQQPQLIIQQTQNPETGELMFFLQGENGEQIELPPEAISNGLVQVRDSEGNDQFIAIALANEDGTPAASTSLLSQQTNLLKTSGESNLTEQIYIQSQQPLEVSADILNNLGAASIAIPAQQLTPTTASTNVVQSVETPRVSTQETTITSDLNNIHRETTTAKIQSDNKDKQIMNDKLSDSLITVVQEIQKKDDTSSVSTTQDLIQNPINNVNLENISNATLLTTTAVGENQDSFVMIADDNNLATIGDLSNQISSMSGQTFYLQTPEGYVQCSTTTDNGSFQILTNDQNQQFIIQNDVPTENQIIETVNENGQAITFTVSSSNNEIELLPVNCDNQQASSLIDLKNSMDIAAKSSSSKSKQSNQHATTKHQHSKQSHSLTQENSNTVLLIQNSETKTITNPQLISTSNKKQNISIIQNINHLSHSNHQNQQQIINNSSSLSRNNKKVQQIQPRNYSITVNSSISKSSSPSTNNYLITPLNNDETNKRHSLTINNNSSQQLQTVNKQDPNNPLSSSKRTYSRKNILWLNPVQTNTSSSTTNKDENKDEKVQLKLDAGDKKSVTITPVKDVQNLKSSQVKKGTITISTVIDKQQTSRNSNIYNQVKIVPSEPHSRLLKNHPTSQSDQTSGKNCSLDDLMSSDSSDDKMENSSTDNSTKRSIEEKSKNSETNTRSSNKRLKRNSFTVNETKDTQNETKKEDKNILKKVDSVNEKAVSDKQKAPLIAKEDVKSESGRRKSPIKPLKDCETNFDEEKKEIKYLGEYVDPNDNDLDDIDMDDTIVTKEIKNIEKQPTSFSKQSESLIKSKESSTVRTRTKSESSTKSENKSESGKSEEETISDVKRRRSGRFSKAVNIEKEEDDKAEKVEKTKKVVITEKECKIDRIILEKCTEKESVQHQSTSTNDKTIDVDSSTGPSLRRGRSKKVLQDDKVESTSKQQLETSKETTKEAPKETIKQTSKEAPKETTKQTSKETPKETTKKIPVSKTLKIDKSSKIETEKRVDEDSLRFDLLFNPKTKTTKESEKAAKDSNQSVLSGKKEDLSNDDQMEIDDQASVSTRNSSLRERTRSSSSNSSKSNKQRVNSSSSVNATEIEEPSSTDSKKRSLRPTTSKTDEKQTKEIPKNETKRRQTISSISDFRKPEEFFDEKLDKCEMHVRYQLGRKSLPSSSKNTASSNNHMCQKCGFTTNRINLLVLHHKSECQVVKSQMNQWQNEIIKSQQLKSPLSKKQRILEFNDEKQYDYSNNRDISDDDLLKDEEEKNEKRFEFEENEIVWVELDEQKVKWPALARKIYLNSEQVSVILIDIPIEDRSSTTKTLYPIKDVITFNNADQNIRFLEETKSKYDDSIVKVVQKAEDYTRKKLLGENLDIKKLLGNNSRRLIMKDEQSADKLVKVNNSNLLKYIKSGKIDSYLLNIYNETIKSERHHNFKNNLKQPNTNYGPFDDYEEDRDDLYNYLKDLFENNSKVDNNFDLVGYILDVWVPEAIIKGISKLYDLSMQESVELFTKNENSSTVDKSNGN